MKSVAAQRIVAAPLSPDQCEEVATWMSLPSVAGPMDLRPPVAPSRLLERVLPVIGRRGQALEEWVVLYGLCASGRRLVGFGVSYGWDLEDDLIRELDFALPGLDKAHPGLAFEALARLAHVCIVAERAIELRTCLRPGPAGVALPRVFSAIGARECALDEGFDSPRDRAARRVVYSLSPIDFFASPAARRWGLKVR